MKNLIKKICLVVFMMIFVGITHNAMAKDLYVATNGSDSTTYAANDISHPWLTVTHAWNNVATGDTVYYREGTYNISVSRIGENNKADTVTHTPYNSEAVTWHSTLHDNVVSVNGDHVTVDGIDINWDGNGNVGGDTGFFGLGWPTAHSATYFTLKNSNYTTTSTGDNIGVFIAKVIPSAHFTLENCTLVGPGRDVQSKNTAGLISFRTQYFTIRNNDISGFYNGLYVNKHSNADGTGGVIENNYIHDCHIALKTTTVDTLISNNIIAGHINLGEDGGSGDASGNDHIGSDRNNFIHNTITDGRLRYYFLDNDPPDNNIYNNNIFTTPLALWWEDHTIPTNTNNFDWNQYISGICVTEGSGHNYTLAEWCAHHGQDENSASANVTFAGGASPATIAGFALTSDSAGKDSASDGADMGVDVFFVGPSASATVTCYPDLDNDLYPGSGSESVATCSANYYEAGYFTEMTPDCNDNDNSIHPNAPDICGNGIAENCIADVDCPTEIRADVDQNSAINSTDAMLTLRNYLGLAMTGTNWVVSATTGDVNCDNSSNSTDAMLILRKSLGLNMGGTGWCIN